MSSLAAEKEVGGAPGTVVRRTVVVVDMVGYSTIAKLLEENISAGSVADLNQQIHFFMAGSLAQVPDPQSFCVVAKTGDGIIVLFHHAEDAHHFARRVHLSARMHNDLRSERSAERWFRVGIATGTVHATSSTAGPCEYAGTTIANAVRLESAAHAGEIVIDRHSFLSLSPESQASYPVETVVRGKRTERFHARRYCVTPHPQDSHAIPHRPLTRRAMLAAGLSVVGAAAVTGWTHPHLLDRWLHPLPSRRSVVVMAWPSAAPERAPFVSSLLDILCAHLSRAGRAIPELFVVNAEDKSDGASVLPAAVSAILTPKLLAEAWGANLILAAFIVEGKAASFLALHVIDPRDNRTLRSDSVPVDPHNSDATTRGASAKAAQLLGLPAFEMILSDAAELSKLSPGNRTLFDEAHYLAKDDNQTRIEEAIARFQDLSMLAPNFALGYAETGILFIRKYGKLHDKSLDSAGPLFEQALRLNPDSQRARLGQARLLLAFGQPMPALRILSDQLKSDPGNRDIMLAQASANRQLNLVPQQLHIYRELIRLYPNFWPAQNDLGKALQRQGDVEEAAHCFERASQLAPRAVIPLINLSSVYLQLNRRSEAEALLKRAAEIAPNPTILENVATLRFEDKAYKEALDLYQQALALTPGTHYILSDIGDCFEMLGQPDRNRDAYTQAADALAADLKVNPTDGAGWMTLAFYQAKIGRPDLAETDIQIAERRGATDVHALFTKARALALMGRTSEAKDLVAYCRTHGISDPEIQLATELAPIFKSLNQENRPGN